LIEVFDLWQQGSGLFQVIRLLTKRVVIQSDGLQIEIKREQTHVLKAADSIVVQLQVPQPRHVR
jgi:hypothetical protein